MNTYAIYKLIKEELKSISAVFYYTGQYLRDKNKTVYKVPVIYIQMPVDIPIDYYGRIRCGRRAVIRLHYLSQAPFGSIENAVQDSAVNAHVTKVLEIINRINGAELKDEDERLICGQCIVTGIESVTFTETFAKSVIRVMADLYDYSGVIRVMAAKQD